MPWEPRKAPVPSQTASKGLRSRGVSTSQGTQPPSSPEMPGGGGARRGAAPGRAYGNRRLQQAGTARKAERPRGAPSSRASQPSRSPSTNYRCLPAGCPPGPDRYHHRRFPLLLDDKMAAAGSIMSTRPAQAPSLRHPRTKTGLPGRESPLFRRRTEIYPGAQPSGSAGKGGKRPGNGSPTS